MLPVKLCFINVYTYHNPKFTFTVTVITLYSRKPTINIFFYLLDCVLLTSKPTPTLNLPLQYSNADTLNIVVQREKK